ncbi:hypothetical protein FCV25MIE_21331 [Fagus crenata]
MARMTLFWDVAYTVYKGIQSYIHYKEIERKRKIAVLKYEESKLKRKASKLQLEAKLRRELLQRLSMEEKSGSLSHSEMISNRGLKQGSRGSNSINKLSLNYVEDSVLKYELSKLKYEASKLQLEAKLRHELLQRLSMEENGGSLSHSEMISNRGLKQGSRGSNSINKLSLDYVEDSGIQSYIHCQEIERKRKIAVLKYELSKLKREASELQLEAKLMRELLQRLSMEEKGGSLTHSEMISNRGLKQGSRGSNSINKLSLDYVEDSGIQSYIHYQEIERKRKIAVLKNELSKLKREASKLQLEAKLRRELLQRLSMEETGGSLSHSEMISNRGLKQGSRGSNSINKLSLVYVEDSGIQSYIHYQEIERKRKIAVLKYELSKLKCEASKLQLEAKLRCELLQRLSMEENGGSLSHSEMISNRELKQGSRGSNSINKLSLDYV